MLLMSCYQHNPFFFKNSVVSHSFDVHNEYLGYLGNNDTLSKMLTQCLTLNDTPHQLDITI